MKILSSRHFLLCFFSIGASFFWLRITHGAQSSGWGLWRCYASFCSYKYRPRFKIL